MDIEIGRNIKTARIAAGLTQEELAKKCGLATITIRQYESGKRGLNVKQLDHVARAIGIDWADLVPDPVPSEEEYAAEEDREIIRNIRPHLSALDQLSNEESALKILLNSMGYDIIKTKGNYFFTYESGGSEISADDLNELLNCAQNGLKIAAKTLELKLMQEALAPFSRSETTPQTPPEPQEGTDTTPPPKGAEGPQDGE